MSARTRHVDESTGGATFIPDVRSPRTVADVSKTYPGMQFIRIEIHVYVYTYKRVDMSRIADIRTRDCISTSRYTTRRLVVIRASCRSRPVYIIFRRYRP